MSSPIRKSCGPDIAREARFAWDSTGSYLGEHSLRNAQRMQEVVVAHS